MMQGEQGQESQSQQIETAPGTPIIVDVFARPGRDDVEFTHEWRFENGPSKGGGAIEVPEKNGATPMHFHLRDETRLQLRFVEPANEAMWVNRDQCPRTVSSDKEIRYGMPPAPKLLKIDNLNSEECTLHFALQFESNEGRKSYDPEIKNGVRTIL